MRAAYSVSMSVGPDETEQLLAKLEAELAAEQAKLDQRLAREQARLDELTRAKEEWEARGERAAAEHEQLKPKRDAMVARREELRRVGSKGSPLRAAFWTSLAGALTLGVVMPLSATPGAMFLVALCGAGVTGSIAWFATDFWLGRRR